VCDDRPMEKFSHESMDARARACIDSGIKLMNTIKSMGLTSPFPSRAMMYILATVAAILQTHCNMDLLLAVPLQSHCNIDLRDRSSVDRSLSSFNP
jgi:hypothetical protein